MNAPFNCHFASPTVERIGEILADLAKKVAKIKEFGKYTFKQLDQFTATEDNCRPATREQRDCFLFNRVLTVEVDTNLEARLDTNVSVNFIIAHGMITQIVVKRVNIQRVSRGEVEDAANWGFC